MGSEHRARVRQAAELARDRTDEAELAALLYGAWYAPAAEHGRRPAHLPALAQVLRAAHAAARESWEPARVIRTGVAGVVVVRTGTGELRAVTRGEYVHSVSGSDEVLVSPIRGAVVSDGWWRTWGGGWNPGRPPTTLSRVYLAVGEGHAADVVAATTSVLATAAHPWLFKLGVDQGTLARPDAGVVYVPDEALASVLVPLATATAGLRRPCVPAMTCEVVPGLAWAQSPAGERSFGETVCELLAAVLVEHPADPVAAVERALVAAGLDPSRPHLRPTVREPVLL